MIDMPDRADGQAGGSDARASDLRRRIADVPVPERLAKSEARLHTAGLILPVLGLVLVGVAWFQASGTPFVSEQVPYLISGAMAGLGVVVIGVGLYVRFSLASLLRFWLARLNAEHQAQTDRVVDALARIEVAIQAQPTARPGPPSPRSRTEGVDRPN